MTEPVTPENIDVPDSAEWYTPHEVALLFRVDPKTVARWEDTGKFTPYNVRCVRTPGKHRRYHRDDINRMFDMLMGRRQKSQGLS